MKRPKIQTTVNTSKPKKQQHRKLYTSTQKKEFIINAKTKLLVTDNVTQSLSSLLRRLCSKWIDI